MAANGIKLERLDYLDRHDGWTHYALKASCGGEQLPVVVLVETSPRSYSPGLENSWEIRMGWPEPEHGSLSISRRPWIRCPQHPPGVKLGWWWESQERESLRLPWREMGDDAKLCSSGWDPGGLPAAKLAIIAWLELPENRELIELEWDAADALRQLDDWSNWDDDLECLDAAITMRRNQEPASV